MTHPALSRKITVILQVAAALVWISGCETVQRPGGSAERRAARLPTVQRTRPEPVHMPGAVAPEVIPAAAEVAAASASVKNSGKLGERLEGDVYYFKLQSVRACDEAGKILGVEVEIEAKAKLNVLPRDVTIGRDGIAFNASLDFERKLPGCAPLLVTAALKRGQVARGFVLFDLPSRPRQDLGLIYQPTRWGGAGYVTVPRLEWVASP